MGREMRRSRSGSKERGGGGKEREMGEMGNGKRDEKEYSKREGGEVRYERREDKERCKGRRKERLTRLERSGHKNDCQYSAERLAVMR